MSDHPSTEGDELGFEFGTVIVVDGELVPIDDGDTGEWDPDEDDEGLADAQEGDDAEA